MSRTNPVSVVYMLTNTVTNKLYIGETFDFVERMSHYRTVERRYNRGKRDTLTPVEAAICKYGFDSFTQSILLSSDEDPDLRVLAYRRGKEAEYISKYNATDPDIGYNVLYENNSLHPRKPGRPNPCSPETRVLKSDPILVYDRNDGSVMMYLGAQSCAGILGISDRSIIISAIKKGKTIHGRSFYKLSFSQRLDTAMEVIAKKANGHMHAGKWCKGGALAKKSLESYIEGLVAVNDWCIKFGYECIDVDSIMSDDHIVHK